jgi:hypothetical protein
MTLFTTGRSGKAMTVPEGEEKYQYAELIMQLPATWLHPRVQKSNREASWPVEWLRQVAYYPHLNETWLGGKTTIISSDEPPVPLGPNTKQTCLLLIADFADWSPIKIGKKEIHFYTVTPIYTDERDFEKKHGVAALLERLKEAGNTAVVDVKRTSVAGERKKKR